MTVGAGSGDPGTINLTGGTLSLSGNFLPADVVAFLSHVDRGGGRVGLSGALDLQGGTFTIDPSTTGSLTLLGGTIKNGTLAVANGAVWTVDGGGVLDTVTLDADVTVSGGGMGLFNSSILGSVTTIGAGAIGWVDANSNIIEANNLWGAAKSLSGTEILVQWHGVVPSGTTPTSFTLSRSTDGVDYEVIGTPPASGIYLDEGLDPGTTYYYQIDAEFSDGTHYLYQTNPTTTLATDTSGWYKVGNVVDQNGTAVAASGDSFAAGSPEGAFIEALSGVISTSSTINDPADVQPSGTGYSVGDDPPEDPTEWAEGFAGEPEGDEGNKPFVPQFKATVDSVQLNSLLVQDANDATNSLNVTNSTPADFWVALDASGRATVNLFSPFAGVTPDTSAARSQILWNLTGDQAAPTNGDFTQNNAITLTPAGARVYTIQAGFDLNQDGVLEANEVARTITMHTLRGDLAVIKSDGSELDNSLKVTQGGYVVLNDDNDSYTFNAAGNPIPDTSATNIPTEHDLVPLTLHALTDPSIGGFYSISTESHNIRLWMEQTKATPVTAANIFYATADTTIYVEGIGESGSRAAEQIVMKWWKPGVTPITVDKVNYTVFTLEGPQNVPGYTQYNYTADVPGGIVAGAGTWSAQSGTIVAQAPDGGSATVGWGSGPTLATVIFRPAPGFLGARDVNVVQIQLATTGNLAHYADKNTAGPVQRPGPGSALIFASSGQDAMTADLYITSITGPTVNGAQRGLRFMEIGLVHEARLNANEGLFNDATPKVRRVSRLQDGLIHLDAAHASTAPWVFMDADSYLSVTSDAAPISAVHFSTFDNPHMLATDVFTIAGTQVNTLVLDQRSWVYLAVRTKDPAAGTQGTELTERAILNWDADLTGNINTAGAFTLTGSGITGDGAFTEVTNGTTVPSFAPNLAEAFVTDTWDTLPQ